jgi:hypothetical protein
LKTLSSFFLIFLFLTSSVPALAGRITKVRGRQAVVQMSGDEFLRLRQRIVLANPNTGDRIGILEITRKKGNRALGNIIKGRARVGALTSPLRGQGELEEEYNEPSSNLADNNFDDSFGKDDFSADSNSQSDQERELASIDDDATNPFETSGNIVADPTPKHTNRGLWGFGLGISPTTIKVQEGTYRNHLKGNNFLVKINYDKPLRRLVSVLLGAGTLPISGSEPDTLLGTAKMEVNYLSFEGNLRLNFSGKASEGLWVGGGLNYLKSTSPGSSNVVDPSSMGDRVLYQISAGYNSGMSAEYLMYRADILMHPSSTSSRNSVNISQTIFSAVYFFN